MCTVLAALNFVYVFALFIRIAAHVLRGLNILGSHLCMIRHGALNICLSQSADCSSGKSHDTHRSLWQATDYSDWVLFSVRHDHYAETHTITAATTNTAVLCGECLKLPRLIAKSPSSILTTELNQYCSQILAESCSLATPCTYTKASFFEVSHLEAVYCSR